MKEQDAAHSFAGEKKLACKKAIQCLYIAVEEPIASDVDNKVSAFVHQLETELTRLRSELQQKNEVIRELIPIAQWKLRSTTDHLYDLRITKEDDPDKFAEVKRLQSLIEKAKLNN